MSGFRSRLPDWAGIVLQVFALVAAMIVFSFAIGTTLFAVFKGEVPFSKVLQLEVVLRILGPLVGLVATALVLKSSKPSWLIGTLRATFVLLLIVYYEAGVLSVYRIVVGTGALGFFGYVLPSMFLLILLPLILLLPSTISFWRQNRIEVF